MTTNREQIDIKRDLDAAREQLSRIEKAISAFSESPQEYSFEISKAGIDRKKIIIDIERLEAELKS